MEKVKSVRLALDGDILLFYVNSSFSIGVFADDGTICVIRNTLKIELED